MSAMAGRSVPGREPVPACSGQPARPRAARGGEHSPSQLAWVTSRGASTGPRSRTWRRGAGRPGGHEGVSSQPRLSPGFSGGTDSPCPNARAQLSSAHLELRTSCPHHHHGRLITLRPASPSKRYQAAGLLRLALGDPWGWVLSPSFSSSRVAVSLDLSSSPGPLLFNYDSQPQCPSLYDGMWWKGNEVWLVSKGNGWCRRAEGSCGAGETGRV